MLARKYFVTRNRVWGLLVFLQDVKVNFRNSAKISEIISPIVFSPHNFFESEFLNLNEYHNEVHVLKRCFGLTYMTMKGKVKHDLGSIERSCVILGLLHKML